MRPTGKKLALLCGALAACAAMFLALLLTDREPPEAAGAEYYFTNYPSAEAVAMVSVENEGGGVVLVQANGTLRALSDYPVPGDGEAIAAFFQEVCHLPLRRLVEGAQASDGQYGLTEPRATVLIQDAAQGGVMFLLGNQVPGGEGVYACLAGDQRVFVMDSAQAELLAQAAASGATVYFALEEPWQMLLGAEPVRNALLTPLRQLEGIRVLEGDPASVHGLTGDCDRFRLRFWDGSAVTVLAGPRDGEYTPVTAEGSGLAMLVPSAALAFMDAPPEEIMGGVLLRLNINDVKTLVLGRHTFGVENSAGALRVTRDGAPWDAAAFQETVFPALNHISIGGLWEDAAGPELLKLGVVSNAAGKTIDLVFRRLDGRRCAVEINGQAAVWCDLAAVSALLDAAD